MRPAKPRYLGHDPTDKYFEIIRLVDFSQRPSVRRFVCVACILVSHDEATQVQRISAGQDPDHHPR